MDEAEVGERPSELTRKSDPDLERARIRNLIELAYGRYHGLLRATPALAKPSILADAWTAQIEYPAETLLWAPLRTAADAVVGLQVLWGSSTPSPPVFAASTLLRQALVGASTARWLLSDIEPTALRKKLGVLALESIRNHRNLESDRRSVLDVTVPIQAEWFELLGKYIAIHDRHMDAVATGALQSSAKNAPRFQQHDAIVQATKATFPGDAGALVRSIMAWRTMSGDAHALPWAQIFNAFENGTLRQPEITGERHMAPVEISLKNYGDSLHDTLEMFEESINLAADVGFDARGWLNLALDD